MKIYIYFTGVAAEIARDILAAFCRHWEVPCEQVTSDDLKKLEEYQIVEKDFSGYYVLSDYAKTKKIIKINADVNINTHAYVLIYDEAGILEGIKVSGSARQREVFNDILKRFEQIVKILE